MKKTIAAMMATMCLASAMAQQPVPATPATEAPQAVPVVAPAPTPVPPAKPFYFQYSLLQIHAFPNYQPYDQGLVKLMFERISSGKYADDYFFFGVNSAHEGVNATQKHEYDETVGTLYFKYAPCLNLDHVFDRDLVPFVGDTYLTVQVNAGDRMDLSLNTVYLGGIAFDVPNLPNYGRCRLYAMVRQEETMKTTHQFTIMWAQPFKTGNLNWVFAGWGAHWANDNVNDVVKFEPQLRLRLNSFVGENNFLYNGIIGAELEVSKNYLWDEEKMELMGWMAQPSIFYAIPF